MTTRNTYDKAKAEQELRAANDKFYAALQEIFVGNLDPMSAVWSHSDDVSLLGPFGGRLQGFESVIGEFRTVASQKLGGKVECKDVLVVPGADVGYTITVEQGENIDKDGKAVPVYFRATNIFRLENGEWKMIHHHTDLSAPLMQSFDVSASAK